MIFEIATTAPECGEDERARQFWRSPPRTLANRNRSDNQVIMTAIKTIEVEIPLECGCARKLAKQPLICRRLGEGRRRRRDFRNLEAAKCSHRSIHAQWAQTTRFQKS